MKNGFIVAHRGMSPASKGFSKGDLISLALSRRVLNHQEARAGLALTDNVSAEYCRYCTYLGSNHTCHGLNLTQLELQSPMYYGISIGQQSEINNA